MNVLIKEYKKRSYLKVAYPPRSFRHVAFNDVITTGEFFMLRDPVTKAYQDNEEKQFPFCRVLDFVDENKVDCHLLMHDHRPNVLDNRAPPTRGFIEYPSPIIATNCRVFLNPRHFAHEIFVFMPQEFEAQGANVMAGWAIGMDRAYVLNGFLNLPNGHVGYFVIR